MPNTIKLKQLDRTDLTAFVNELIDGTGVVYTANRALVTDSSGDVVVSSVTSTELGYLSGVTSAIQTQLNAKQATITGGATSITSSDLTASRALTSDASGKVAVSSVTTTELGYVSGVTSAIQTQINAKFTLPSLTSGSVLFSNGTTISQDNSNLVWDNSNKRLGIGTAPSYRFHVAGTTSTMAIQYQNTTSGNSVYFQCFDANTFEHYYGNSSGYYQIRASQTRIQGIESNLVVLTVKGASSQTANLQQWQNSSGTVLANISSDGYLSIGNGSTAAAEKIHLKGGDPAIKLENAASSSWLLQVLESSGTFRIRSGSDWLSITTAGAATFAGTVKSSGGYISSDGSTGATGTATSANTLTIKNGLVTNIA